MVVDKHDTNNIYSLTELNDHLNKSLTEQSDCYSIRIEPKNFGSSYNIKVLFFFFLKAQTYRN